MISTTTAPEAFRLTRSGYWAWMISLLGIQIFFAYVLGSTDEFTTVLVLLICARFVVVYARIKDIGWHGARTVLAILPLVWIYFGCKETNSAKHLQGEDS